MLRGHNIMLRNFISIFKYNSIHVEGAGVQNAKRHLYSSTALGMDGYKDARDRTQIQFKGSDDKFREKMLEFIDKPGSMVFTEDLKNIVHLAEKKPEDMNLVMQMVKKFVAQNKDLRFGNFVFGPVVLRMFYHLQEEESALKCFTDPETRGFFDQLVSFQLLLDLLYEKGKYQTVLDVFDDIKSRQIQGGKYPKHSVVLAFAACYKLNTPESFKYASNLWNELMAVGHIAMRKAGTFAAGLAVKQNASHAAIEILTTIREQNYLTVRNLKATAYAELGRPDDALAVLRSVLEIDEPGSRPATFVLEVVENVKKSIAKSQRKDLETDFERIFKFFKDHGHLTEETLDDILCRPIASTSFSTTKRERTIGNFNRDNYRKQNTTHQPRYALREGLNDRY